MESAVQYIVNDQGVKTSVIVPFERWEELNSDFKKMKNKLDVFSAVKEGFEEISRSKYQNEEFQSLTDFIDECKG